MPLAVTYSRAHVGMEAPLVTIEAHLSSGLPAFNIVGLPEAAVREAKDRVRSAILNSQFDFPNGRITVNMAPADLPKQGGQFDLAIALGILAASEQIDAAKLTQYEW
ncbi:MAG: magnesium chelatase domain-containing protein, partial [Reinekea sp.]|nr:magnesium chelatase domain-containing protein [Reinekea sp.]